MKNGERFIDLNDFDYHLPEGRIAKYPLAKRSSSNLLTFKKGEISHQQFFDLPKLLPESSTLVFNNTRVIPARLYLQKETGAIIELFLLEPLLPYTDSEMAMQVKGTATWKCMIGNLKKWKSGQVLQAILNDGPEIKAELEDRDNQLVKLSWPTDLSFIDLLEEIGKIPLPPYIQREVEEADKERYQTVYSQFNGAVAAPTAGLHFDDQVLDELKDKDVPLEYVTLHVSAGTFRPVKEDNALDHDMHYEQVIIHKSTIKNVLNSTRTIAVGTTSMRTLESLYWFGVKCLKNENERGFEIEKLYPYQHDSLPTKTEALNAVLDYINQNDLETLEGKTGIYMFPGYEFKLVSGLITNYHLPKSTLILLIAAFVGDKWREIYKEALKKNYRFLSYGDSSLLLP